MFLLLSAGCITLASCHKTEVLKTPIPASSEPLKNSSGSGGGGGTSGGGGTGGGGSTSGSGGSTTTTTTTDPSLAPADTTTSPLPIANIITVGHWKVTSFVQGNDNFTSQFANDVFTFNSDGSMVADENGIQTIGTWHYQDAVFYYGIPVYGSSPYGFTMTIGTQVPLIELDKNYFISKKTLTTVYIDSINPNENAHITLSKLAQ